MAEAPNKQNFHRERLISRLAVNLYENSMGYNGGTDDSCGQCDQRMWLSFVIDRCNLTIYDPVDCGCSGLVVEYRTRNREGLTHTRSTASNLEQVANLLCAQANSAPYPQRDGKWVVATAIRGEGLVWLTGAMVYLLAVPWVQLSVSAGNGWPHNALRHH